MALKKTIVVGLLTYTSKHDKNKILKKTIHAVPTTTSKRLEKKIFKKIIAVPTILCRNSF